MLIISQSLALCKPSVLLRAKVDAHSSPGLKALGFSGHANKHLKINSELATKRVWIYNVPAANRQLTKQAQLRLAGNLFAH